MKNKSPISLLDMPIWKALVVLSIPIVITNLLQVAYQFTDSFWVGRLWEEAIATTTLAWMIIFLTISIWSWFSVAGSILISQFFWAKKFKQVDHIAAQTLLMITLTSIFLWWIWYFFTPHILHLMWADSNIFNQTVSYIRWSFVGLVFNFAFFMFQAIMRWIGQANLPIYIVLFTVLLNFLLDPLFIYWYWSFEWMWVIWAAIATILTQSIASIIWFIVLFSWKYNIHLHWRDFIPDFSTIKKTFFLWLPSSIEMTARSGSFAILTAIVAIFWTTALASFWVAWNTIQFVVIFAMWLSMATSVLVWQSVWAWLIEKAKRINKISSFVSFTFLTLLWIISFIFAEYFIKFFIPNDPEVIKMWTEIIRISALFFWLIWVQMSLNGVLRAIGKTQIPMYITILWQWIIKIPIAYILAKYTYLWINGVWWSEPITSIIICIIMFFVMIKVDWSKSNLTKEHKQEQKVIEETIIEEPIKDF